MTTISKPILTTPPEAASAAPSLSEINFVEDEKYASNVVDETLLDGHLPVPLYVIAAAALLG
jgi:hypothetical protein